ncbi:MAG: phosphatidylserine decarboxylase [Sulfurimonas sp.]|jgi:phosphatidylserine decarboxylase|uniref:phosphatidylserine decarboxylase n=1 Tax=Sulfurimonas sp. TaxID=2022749 RepID=UPI0039E2E5EC
MQKWSKIQMRNNLLPIAKEGWSYVGYSLGFFALFSILGWGILQFFSFAVVVFFLFVFRNPERELPNFDAKSVLCPVDGEVISIDTLTDNEYAYKVSIDTTYKDVGILRAPMNASLICVNKKHGTRLSLDNPIALQTNENVSIVFQDSNANKIKVLHTVKQSLCGVIVDVEQDKSIAQSARYGIMVNGITHIYLPLNFRLSLILGEEITASKSLVGYFS